MDVISYVQQMAPQTPLILSILGIGLFLLIATYLPLRRLNSSPVSPSPANTRSSSASKTPASLTSTITSTSLLPSDNERLMGMLSRQLQGLADQLETQELTEGMRSWALITLGRCFAIL